MPLESNVLLCGVRACRHKSFCKHLCCSRLCWLYSRVARYAKSEVTQNGLCGCCRWTTRPTLSP